MNKYWNFNLHRIIPSFWEKKLKQWVAIFWISFRKKSILVMPIYKVYPCLFFLVQIFFFQHSFTFRFSKNGEIKLYSIFYSLATSYLFYITCDQDKICQSIFILFIKRCGVLLSIFIEKKQALDLKIQGLFLFHYWTVKTKYIWNSFRTVKGYISSAHVRFYMIWPLVEKSLSLIHFWTLHLTMQHKREWLIKCYLLVFNTIFDPNEMTDTKFVFYSSRKKPIVTW